MSASRDHGPSASQTRPLEATRVLLIHSARVEWIGLQTILRRDLGLAIIGDTMHPTEGVEAARVLRPDAIFVGTALAGTTIITLAAQLREASRVSKTVVLTEDPEPDVLRALLGEGIWGYLLWREVAAGMIRCTLWSIIEAGLVVVSLEAGQDLVVLRSSRPTHHGAGGP